MCKLEFKGNCVLIPVHAEENGVIDYKIEILLGGTQKEILEILCEVGLEICIIEKHHSSVTNGEFNRLIFSLTSPDKEFEYTREFSTKEDLHFLFPHSVQYTAYSLVPFIHSLSTTIH